MTLLLFFLLGLTLKPSVDNVFQLSLEQIRDAAFSFKASERKEKKEFLREWRLCSLGKQMTLKVSIRAFLSVTLGLTSSQRRENTSRVSWDVREWSVCRFPVKRHIFVTVTAGPHRVLLPVCRQKESNNSQAFFLDFVAISAAGACCILQSQTMIYKLNCRESSQWHHQKWQHGRWRRRR